MRNTQHFPEAVGKKVFFLSLYGIGWPILNETVFKQLSIGEGTFNEQA